MRRWIVIYYNGDETKAALIVDDYSDGSVSMPFGVEPRQIADDCEDITAIVELPNCQDDVPMIVIDDEEFSLEPSDPDVDVEDVPDQGDLL